MPYSAADARTGGSGNLATLVLIGRRTLHLVERGYIGKSERGEREGRGREGEGEKGPKKARERERGKRERGGEKQIRQERSQRSEYDQRRGT